MRRADNLTAFMCRLSWNLGAGTSWKPQGLSRAVMGLLSLFTICTGSLRTGWCRGRGETSPAVQTGPEFPHPPAWWTLDLSPGVKRPELGADVQSPPIAGLRMSMSYTSSSPQCLHRHVMGNLCLKYVVGSKSFRPDIQKPRQMENAVRDI